MMKAVITPSIRVKMRMYTLVVLSAPSSQNRSVKAPTTCFTVPQGEKPSIRSAAETTPRPRLSSTLRVATTSPIASSGGTSVRIG